MEDEVFAPRYRYSNYTAETVSTDTSKPRTWLEDLRTTTKKVIYSMLPMEPCDWNLNIPEEYDDWKEWSQKNRDKILNNTGYDVTRKNDFEEWYFNVYLEEKDFSESEEEYYDDEQYSDEDYEKKWVQYTDEEIIRNPELDIGRYNRIEKTEYGTIYYDRDENEISKAKWDKEWENVFYEK